jgi:hypothetical protein
MTNSALHISGIALPGIPKERRQVQQSNATHGDVARVASGLP